MKVKTENRLGIQTPAHVIWEIITDLSTWHEWNPLYPQARGVIGYGERLTLTEASPHRRPRVIRPVVLDWAPDEAIHWRMSLLGGLRSSIHYLEIEKLHDTGCIFSNGELFEGLFLSTIGRRARRKLRDGYTLMNEALRDHAEARWRAMGGEPT